MSVFHNEKEYILNQRAIGPKGDFSVEMREALRKKELLVKKLFPSLSKPEANLMFRKSVHTVYKLNQMYFVDLAGIEGLSSKRQETVDVITQDFSVMANQILKQSKFYEKANFEETNSTPFTRFLQETIDANSSVSIFCVVSSLKLHYQQAQIAMDYV